MTDLADLFARLGPNLVQPLIVFAVTAAAGFGVRLLLFHSLRTWARRTPTDIDDIILAAFSAPARLWVVILAADLAVKYAKLSDETIGNVDKALLLLWVLSLTLAASKLFTSLFARYGSSFKGAAPVTTLAQNLIRLVVVSIGVLLMLNAIGVSITPMLTALGVGGLALALGMQETLANLFAGFFVSIAGNVRIGDYIKLNSGEEGYVADITWRATTLRMLSHNLIIIPNANLARALVTNYSLPETRMSATVPINVSLASDPERVERVLQDEAARAIGEVPGLLAEPAPFARLTSGFGDYALQFTVFVTVEDFVAQFPVQHELRKRIFRRLAAEGIEIPIPTRALVVDGRPKNVVPPKS
jgi:small-conductance mechanosensitive channel